MKLILISLTFAYATSADDDAPIAGFSKVQLTQKWWNWNLCNDAYNSPDVVPRDALVPAKVFFLAGKSNDDCAV